MVFGIQSLSKRHVGSFWVINSRVNYLSFSLSNFNGVPIDGATFAGTVATVSFSTYEKKKLTKIISECRQGGGGVRLFRYKKKHIFDNFFGDTVYMYLFI